MLTLAMAISPAMPATAISSSPPPSSSCNTATLLHDDVVDQSELRPRQTVRADAVGQRGQRAGRRLFAGPGVSHDGRGREPARAGHFVLGCRDHRRRRSDAAGGCEKYRHHRGRISRRDPRQDRRAVHRRLRSRPGDRQPAQGRADRLPFGRHESRHRVQLVDDVLDYGGKAAKLGKNVGDDFREGKITLPVVLASAAATTPSAHSGSRRWSAARSRTAIWTTRLVS